MFSRNSIATSSAAAAMRKKLKPTNSIAKSVLPLGGRELLGADRAEHHAQRVGVDALQQFFPNCSALSAGTRTLVTSP